MYNTFLYIITISITLFAAAPGRSETKPDRAAGKTVLMSLMPVHLCRVITAWCCARYREDWRDAMSHGRTRSTPSRVACPVPRCPGLISIRLAMWSLALVPHVLMGAQPTVDRGRRWSTRRHRRVDQYLQSLQPSPRRRPIDAWHTRHSTVAP
jgi:hypothetical protein